MTDNNKLCKNSKQVLLFSYVDHMPKVGETLIAHSFISSPGGKGANSIVASSRLGSNNVFISKVIELDIMNILFNLLIASDPI